MDTQQQSGSEVNPLESEIKALEKVLAERKAAFESGKQKKAESFSHKEALHEIVGEKIAEVYQPLPTRHVPDDGTQAPQSNLSQNMKARPHPQADDRTKQMVQDMINLAFDKGISHAVHEVKKLDPYIMDEFHHALVDQLHDELIRRGILEEI